MVDVWENVREGREGIDLYDLNRLYLGIVWRDLVIPTYNPSVNKTLFL